MNRTKVLKGMGVTMRRSEYEDTLLQNNARFDNRLNRDIRQVERAKKVVSKGYEKESQWLKQKLANSPAYTSKRGTFPLVGSMSARGHGAPHPRLVPDWDHIPHTASPQKIQSLDVLDESKPSTEKPKSSVLTNGQEGFKIPEVQLPEGDEHVTEADEEAETKVVKPRRHKVPDHFWENLSAPKHKSSVRNVRDRLQDEFKKTNTKATVHQSKSAPALSSLTRSKTARK